MPILNVTSVHFPQKVVHKNKQFKLLYTVTKLSQNTCASFRFPISNLHAQTKLTKNAQVSKHAKCIKEKPQIMFLKSKL